ncbi:aldehyde dehydrogenase (NADP(+)) [Spelaeicoccus albus]|uniref:NADP-dependent aldehyde dehydrogenase n=1 Tax=Spelaeicoccus albus TaxID=1280376 RepID=A0A7Z0AB85_9MICO|nr:aldehyde dehydrogenase (NADP(+)) [Spelaeicoccus albus]NYI66680.1 NADP-dependent aldehyde dehydrogenase [Spelaeicoccus albus]
MTLTGKSLIAGHPVFGTAGTVNAVNPATDEQLEPRYGLVDEAAVADAAAAAADAFDTFRQTTPGRRADFLDRAADNIDAVGDELVPRTVAETALPEAVVRGELARTTNQLRLFATMLRDGGDFAARIDPAKPDRTPAPRVDIRQRQIAIGPVAVFGASNFPLAFSTAGGDTASALAAGCPVIVKAHSAHPGSTELVARAVSDAVSDAGLPAGVFSALFGSGPTVGQALVADPRIQAVGFTGSRSGGTALMKTAAERPCPIPVHAEMSSINPVFVLPAALAADPDALAAEFVASLTTRAGQLCTNPGLLFVPATPDGDVFADAAANAVRGATGQTMLTPGIQRAYASGKAELEGLSGVDLLAEGTEGDAANSPAPALFGTTSETFRATPRLQEEVFGAASLIVRYADIDDAVALAKSLQGQLTATIRFADDDHDAAAALMPVLERTVGRILFNGWPTGVEVGHAMVHGGPFPATSDSRTTSVGTLAIRRFQRPVSYQNVPEALLPDAVKPGNPWKLPRTVDGRIELP